MDSTQGSGTVDQQAMTRQQRRLQVRQEIRRRVRGRVHQLVLERARQDVVAFARYVMRDKRGRPWNIAPIHGTWQEFLTEHAEAVLLAPAEHGKTQWVVARILWELGRNPDLTIAVVSNAAKQAYKISRACMDHLERNPRLREVFPHLLPGNPARNPNEVWSVPQWTVAGRTLGINDPSVQALGIHGAIQGARLDLLLIDDPCDMENTSTQEQRDKSLEWFRASAFSRLSDGGRCWVFATTWHGEDFPHQLIAEGWASRVDRAIVQEGDASALDGSVQVGMPLWPAWWSLERLEKTRKRLGTWEFERQMQNNPRDDATSLIKLEWLRTGLRLSLDPAKCPILGVVPELRRIPPKCGVFIGVDLAFTKSRKSDETAFVVVLVTPERRHVLHVITGKFNVREAVQQFADLRLAYRDPVFVVENVAAQEWALQTVTWLTKSLCIPYTTGKGEASLDWAASKFAIELEQGRWTIPAAPGGDRGATSAVQVLIQQILAFKPDVHCGDAFAAMLMVRDKCDRRMGRVDVTGSVLSRR